MQVKIFYFISVFWGKKGKGKKKQKNVNMLGGKQGKMKNQTHEKEDACKEGNLIKNCNIKTPKGRERRRKERLQFWEMENTKILLKGGP